MGELTQPVRPADKRHALFGAGKASRFAVKESELFAKNGNLKLT
jgi:hypothetical protein